MTARTKSILIIIGTLFIGVAIGALSTGAIMNQRVDELQALREDDGFIFFVERVVQPTDEVQRDEIRVVLKEAAQKRRELRRSTMEQHVALFSEIREDLDQILTMDQKDRLRAFAEQEMRRGRLPIRRPRPFGRGRPDGMRPDSADFREFRERMRKDSLGVQESGQPE